MTEKLYDADAYIKEFDATVVSCEVDEKGNYNLILDKTAFFPMEGGQTPDKGTINGIEVFDVKIEGEIIVHTVGSKFLENQMVHGCIDWKHRYRNMQMHSGEHIFSGLIHGKYGFNNVGFHLSDNSATCDYDGKLTVEQVKEIEIAANEVIWENHEITATFPSLDELKTLDYRSKGEVDGAVRIVNILDVDLCACCAPHVKRTGEIGLFKVVSVENYKGGIRVNFLCGERALHDYVRLNDLEAFLCKSLNSKGEGICDSIDKLKNQVSKLEYDNVSLRRNNIIRECERCDNGILFLEKEDEDQLRFAVNELRKSKGGVCFSLAGNDNDGYRFVIEAGEKDLSDLKCTLSQNFDFKGGGKGGSMQGTIRACKENLLAFYYEYMISMSD